jgi:hypothetical protein
VDKAAFSCPKVGTTTMRKFGIPIELQVAPTEAVARTSEAERPRKQALAMPAMKRDTRLADWGPRFTNNES